MVRGSHLKQLNTEDKEDYWSLFKVKMDEIFSKKTCRIYFN